MDLLFEGRVYGKRRGFIFGMLIRLIRGEEAY